jgi:hypothetical protein
VVTAPNLVLNVKTYGATGNGSTDDTTALQAAYTALASTGGTAVYPAGTFIVSHSIFVPSNVRSEGAGAGTVIKASASYNHAGLGDYAMFVNSNYPSSTSSSYTLNQNISFDNMSFSYANLQNVAGGGTHAIRMYGVTGVSVTNSYFNYGNDAVATINSANVQDIGNTALNIENAAFDNWQGPTNVRVTSNYTTPSVSNPNAPGVQFDAGDGTGSDTRVANGLVVTGNIFYGFGIGLDTLSTNGSATNINISGNVLNGGAVIGRGAIAGTVISNNTLSTGPSGSPLIWIDQATGGNPSNTTVIGNVIVSPGTSLLNSNVIRLYGGGVVANNQVQAGAGTFNYTVGLSGGTFYGSGNDLVAGSTGKIVGTLYTADTIALPGGGTVDASGNAVFAKVTSNQYFNATGHFVYLNTEDGWGVVASSGASSNSQLEVDLGSANNVQLYPSGGTNTNLSLHAGSGGSLMLTGLPTTCSGKPTNSVAAVAGVLTLCP